MASADVPDTRRIELSENLRAARVALEPDEMPEPHDFERVRPYVFGQREDVER